MAAALGGIDALVFCGGIGENSRTVRARVCDDMDWLGITLDPDRNAANAPRIDCGRVAVMSWRRTTGRVIARAVTAALNSGA